MSTERTDIQSSWHSVDKNEYVTSVESEPTESKRNLSSEGDSVGKAVPVEMFPPAREDVQPVNYILPQGGSTITDASNSTPSTLAQCMTTMSYSTDTATPSYIYNTAISFPLNPNATQTDITVLGSTGDAEGFLSDQCHCRPLDANTAFKCIKLDIKVPTMTPQTLPPQVILSLPPCVSLSDPESKGSKDTMPLENLTTVTQICQNTDNIDEESSPADAASQTPSSLAESQISYIIQRPGRLETKDWKQKTGNKRLETKDWKQKTGNKRLEPKDWKQKTGTKRLETKAPTEIEKACETLNENSVQNLPEEAAFYEPVTKIQEIPSMTETNIYRIINKYDDIQTDQEYKTQEVTPMLPAEIITEESPRMRESKVFKVEKQVHTYVEVPLKIEELLGEYWKENTASSLLDEPSSERPCSLTKVYKDVKYELEIPAVVIGHCQTTEDCEEKCSSIEATGHGLVAKRETKTTEDISPYNNVPTSFELKSKTNKILTETSADVVDVTLNIRKGQTPERASTKNKDIRSMEHDSATREKSLAAMKRLEMLVHSENGQDIAGKKNLHDRTNSKTKSNTQQSCSVSVTGDDSERNLHESTEHHMGKGHFPLGKKIPAIKRLDILIYDT